MKIKINNLNKKFDRQIIKNFSFEFQDKGLYCILGESGSGKSTILRMISGIDYDYEGIIEIDNTNLKNKNDNFIRNFRFNNIGIIHQNFNLFENNSVLSNLKIVLENAKLGEKEKEELINKTLIKLGLIKLKNENVKNLSGGEKSRVAIARVFLQSPKIILADEPSGALDFKNSKKVFKLLHALSKHILVIVVTHDEYFAKLYADYILKINDLKIDVIKNQKFSTSNKIMLLNKIKRKNKFSLSLSFIFKQFKENLINKKIINICSLSLITLSLFLFGFTSTIKEGISSTIKESFENIAGENSLIISSKNEVSLIDYYSCSKNDIINIQNESKYVDKIGVKYFNNFVNFFPDLNEVSILSEVNTLKTIDNFKIEYFLNYNFKENISSLVTYPNLNKLNKDSCVLGLNEETMMLIANKLFIEPTFVALGNYIEKYNPIIIIKLQNDYWTYYDELTLNLKGISPSNSNCVYSSCPFFNEYILEERLLFPSLLDQKVISEEPWMLYKNYFFESENPTKVIEEISNNPYFDQFLYDLSYNNIHENKLVLVYFSLNNQINKNIVNSLKNEINIDSYFCTSKFGYSNVGSILVGFSQPTFFAKNYNQLESLYSENKIEYEDYFYLTTENEILFGNYLNNDKKVTKFKNLNTQKINGRSPLSVNEICVSSNVLESLNLKLNDSIYMSTFTNLYLNNEKIEYKYEILDFKIVGYIEENNNYIYQYDDFLISIYRDKFKISPENLLIENITLFLNFELSSEDLNTLNEKYSDYIFLNPLENIEESINQTLETIINVLHIFSYLVLIMTTILLMVLTYINFLHLKKEIYNLMILGLSDFEIIKKFFVSNLFISFISLFLSIFLIIFANIFVSLIIQKMLGSFVLLKINIEIILMLILVMFMISLFSVFLIFFSIKRFKYKKYR